VEGGRGRRKRKKEEEGEEMRSIEKEGGKRKRVEGRKDGCTKVPLSFPWACI
jgi:hypothetical protein